MRRSVICEFGDVVVVPFPSVDQPGNKRRPSAVLSGHAINAANGHTICAMITTATCTRWPSDVAISDLAAAGLPRPCVVRWKLFTLPNGLFLRRAGKLAGDDLARIASTLRAVMA
jgi:mRNA interferase MazF